MPSIVQGGGIKGEEEVEIIHEEKLVEQKSELEKSSSFLLGIKNC